MGKTFRTVVVKTPTWTKKSVIKNYCNFKIYYLIANRSTFSITGAVDKSADAFAISASAILPSRWACLPSSVLNVSKIPKVDGPNCKAYHLTVSGSASAYGKALFRKAKTSFSLPGLASTRANNANFSMVQFLKFK